jgi:putative N-acetylmannosamine-6-phosphate epimerase
MIALDLHGTWPAIRPSPANKCILDEIGVPALADIATAEEAATAAQAGAAAVLTTQRGFPDDMTDVKTFEPAFVSTLRRHCQGSHRHA